jgi:short-subunit dehydrogenase
MDHHTGSGYCGQTCSAWFFDVPVYGASKDNIDVTLICPGFVQTNEANNAPTADGSKENKDDVATSNKWRLTYSSLKISKGQKLKNLRHIGRKEVLGVSI